MQELDAQEIINELIRQAKDNQHLEFYKLDNLFDYFYYLDQRRALRVTLRVLRNCLNFLFSDYCREVANGTGDFNKLLAYKEFEYIIEYYQQEFNTVNDMLDEYENYMILGGFLPALLGIPRGDC